MATPKVGASCGTVACLYIWHVIVVSIDSTFDSSRTSNYRDKTHKLSGPRERTAAAAAAAKQNN